MKKTTLHSIDENYCTCRKKCIINMTGKSGPTYNYDGLLQQTRKTIAAYTQMDSSINNTSHRKRLEMIANLLAIKIFAGIMVAIFHIGHHSVEKSSIFSKAANR